MIPSVWNYSIPSVYTSHYTKIQIDCTIQNRNQLIWDYAHTETCPNNSHNTNAHTQYLTQRNNYNTGSLQVMFLFT